MTHLDRSPRRDPAIHGARAARRRGAATGRAPRADRTRASERGARRDRDCGSTTRSESRARHRETLVTSRKFAFELDGARRPAPGKKSGPGPFGPGPATARGAEGGLGRRREVGSTLATTPIHTIKGGGCWSEKAGYLLDLTQVVLWQGLPCRSPSAARRLPIGAGAAFSGVGRLAALRHPQMLRSHSSGGSRQTGTPQ